MSRIGYNPITIEDKVEITVNGTDCLVKGPKGELSLVLPAGISLEIKDGEALLTRENEEDHTKALHGTYRALISNMVKGVVTGFERRLELHGVGYRVKKEGSDLSLTVGYTHPVIIKAVDGVEYVVPDETTIILTGIDKQKVNTAAAKIRELKKPEPYKGKGIRYDDEYVRRKTPKSITSE